jgi:hypothetical protein
VLTGMSMSHDPLWSWWFISISTTGTYSTSCTVVIFTLLWALVWGKESSIDSDARQLCQQKMGPGRWSVLVLGSGTSTCTRGLPGQWIQYCSSNDPFLLLDWCLIPLS